MKTDSNYDIIAAITRQIDVEHQTIADENFRAFFEQAVNDPNPKTSPAVQAPVAASNNDIIKGISIQVDVEHQTIADENFWAFFENAVKSPEKKATSSQASATVTTISAIDYYRAFLPDEYSA